MYDRFLAPFTELGLAVWIIVFVGFLDNHTSIVNRIAGNRFVTLLEAISYEIYIVHYMFIEGCLSAEGVINNPFIMIIAVFVASFIAAFFVHRLSMSAENLKRGKIVR